MKTAKFRWLCAVAAMAMAAFGCKEPEVNNGRVPEGGEGNDPADTKEFVIYDGLHYNGKPDLQDDKISPFGLIYEAFLLTDGQIDEAKINQQINILKLTGVNTISLDIEEWYSTRDEAGIKEGLTTVFNMFREALPGCNIGNYGIPVADLNVHRGYRPDMSEEEIISTWKANGEKRMPVGEVCDVLYPSLYAYSSDMDQWVEDLKTTVAFIKEYYPNKKIVGYIWPQYYNHKQNPEYQQFITKEKATQMLDACYEYLDGIALWSHGKDEKDQEVGWSDPRVQEFYSAVKELINKHYDNIKLDLAQGATLEGREPSEFAIYDALNFANKPADMRAYGMQPINYIKYSDVSVAEKLNDINEPDYDKIAHVAKNVKNLTVFSQGNWIVDRSSANVIMDNRFKKIHETFKENNAEAVLGFGGVGPTALTQIQGQYHYETEFARKDSWLRFAVEPTRILRQYADVLVPVVNMIDDDLNYWKDDCMQVFSEAAYGRNQKKVYALIETTYVGDATHPETFEGCGSTIKEETFLAGLEHLWQYCDGIIVVGGGGATWDENNAIVKALKTFYENHKAVIDQTLPTEVKHDVIPEYVPEQGGEGGEGGEATGNLVANGDFETIPEVTAIAPALHANDVVKLPRVKSFFDPTFQTSHPTVAANTLVGEGQWFLRFIAGGWHWFAYIDGPEMGYSASGASVAHEGKQSLGLYATDGRTASALDNFKHYTNNNMHHLMSVGQKVALDDTKTYTLKFWYYLPSKTWQSKDNGAKTITAGIVSSTGANAYTDYTYEESITIEKKDEWVEYTMTLDLPKIIEANPGKSFKTAAVFFSLTPEFNDALTTIRCQVNIDDVSLTQN